MTTKEFLNRFTREEGIALFNTKKTEKEIYDLFVSKGLTDSYETFTAEAQKVFDDKISKMSKEEMLKQIEGAELTDEQLEMIAGGSKDGKPHWGGITDSEIGDQVLIGTVGSISIIGAGAAALA